MVAYFDLHVIKAGYQKSCFSFYMEDTSIIILHVFSEIFHLLKYHLYFKTLNIHQKIMTLKEKNTNEL